MRELSLFSGGGGGLLGTVHLLGFTPVGYVEWDDYCQRLLGARIDGGYLPNAPIYGDIRAFISDGYARAYQGMVDVITAGFPCQPFSQAGARRGEDDERNMWPETIECIRQVRPRWALLENVPGLISTDYFGQILCDVAEAGFDAEWDIVSAAEVGAPHIRKRLWILCHTNGNGESAKSVNDEASGMSVNVTDTYSDGVREQSGGRSWACRSGAVQSSVNGEERNAAYASCERRGEGRTESVDEGETFSSSNSGDVSDTVSSGCGPKGGRLCEGESSEFRGGRSTDGNSKAGEIPDTDSGRLSQRDGIRTRGQETDTTVETSEWWAAEPAVGRVVNGLAHRVDRIRAIGNGQVPRVVEVAWQILRGSFDA